jgi:hypothetical protein
MGAMKLFYKPYSIVSKMIAAKVGQKAFTTLWARVSKSPKPSPKEPEADLGKVAVSSALEGATLAATAAVVTQLSLRLYRHLFGVWPEKAKAQAAAQSPEPPAPPIVVEPPVEAKPGLGTRLRRVLPGATSAQE